MYSRWFHEVEGDLREALLLQVRDDGLAAQPRVVDHPHDVPVLLVVERHLEERLRALDLHLARLSTPFPRFSTAPRACESRAMCARAKDGRLS